MEENIFIEDDEACRMVPLQDHKINRNVTITEYSLIGGDVFAKTLINNYGTAHVTVSGICRISLETVTAYIEEEYGENCEKLELRLHLEGMETAKSLKPADIEHIVQSIF